MQARRGLAALLGAVLGCGDSTGPAPASGSETGASEDGSTAASTTTAIDATTEAGSTTIEESARSSTGDPCDCVPGECPPQCFDPLAPEIGFIEIEPIDFPTRQRTPRRSCATRST